MIVQKYIPITVVVIELVDVPADGRVNMTNQVRAILVAVEVAGHLGAGYLGKRSNLRSQIT